jgi:1-acyl-sn-glycerol-3-phosphate acyltransferase
MLERGRRHLDARLERWRDRGTAYEVARLLTSPARRLLVRLDVEGLHHLPADGPAIVAANHLSFFDSVLLMFDLPRQVCMLGKAEYTERRVTNWLFCGAGMIPVRRQNVGEAAHALDKVEAVLAGGSVVGLFPEGTRSRDGLLHRGHPGVAHLSLRTGAPIVPVGIEGTDAVLPSGARIVRPFRRATVRIGAPIDPRALGFERSSHQARRAVTDELMDRIRELSRQQYDDHYAPIPAATPGAV